MLETSLGKVPQADRLDNFDSSRFVQGFSAVPGVFDVPTAKSYFNRITNPADSGTSTMLVVPGILHLEAECTASSCGAHDLVRRQRPRRLSLQGWPACPTGHARHRVRAHDRSDVTAQLDEAYDLSGRPRREHVRAPGSGYDRILHRSRLRDRGLHLSGVRAGAADLGTGTPRASNSPEVATTTASTHERKSIRSPVPVSVPPAARGSGEGHPEVGGGELTIWAPSGRSKRRRPSGPTESEKPPSCTRRWWWRQSSTRLSSAVSPPRAQWRM